MTNDELGDLLKEMYASQGRMLVLVEEILALRKGEVAAESKCQVTDVSGQTHVRTD